jgi:thiamine pyrophosphokinase
MICWDFPQAVLMDEKQKAYVLTEGKHTITDAFRHVSFFACEDSIVSLHGFEYDGNNLKMGARQYYGVSNALKYQSASIDVLKGKVLCIESGWN